MKKTIFILSLLVQSHMFSQTLEKEIKTIFNENKLMGLTVLTFKGNLVQTYNIGLQNELTKTPVSDQTTFRIASVSKAFTALGLLKLFDQKKFKLNDDISQYLGYKVINPKYPHLKITFRMLLNHTSSLQDGKGYDRFLEKTFYEKECPNISSILTQDGVYNTEDMWINKKPGDYFTYCNLNYGLIGTLIEKISRQRFDLYIKNEILEPLGITASFNLNDISKEKLATLYRSENNSWKPEKDNYDTQNANATDFSSYIIGTNATYFGPQGSLRISAKDLSKFLRFIKSNGETVSSLISKKTIKKMKKANWCFTNNNGDTNNGFFKQYGLGLHLTNTSKSDLVNNIDFFGLFIGHAGDAYGLISDAYFSEKQDFGFVIITNGSFDAFVAGKSSSFYNFEEAIFKLICEDYMKNY